MSARIEATITGRVQLVMFRDFTQRKARRLGLVGTVRNMPDGSVLVRAEGDQEDLKKLISYLERGSVLSRVDHVEVRWCEPEGNLKDFRIVY